MLRVRDEKKKSVWACGRTEQENNVRKPVPKGLGWTKIDFEYSPKDRATYSDVVLLEKCLFCHVRG